MQNKKQIIQENDLKYILPELQKELREIKIQKGKQEIRNKNKFIKDLKVNLKNN